MGSFTMKEGDFHLVDYIVFAILIIISCAGGVWYGVTSSKLKKIMDVKDYLLGGRELKTLPVALSLIASYISGVTLLGTPAEIYNYGSQYTVVVFGVALSCVAVVWFYLPVFLTLKLSSSYEYLELRFNRHVRACASLLFLLDEILFLPMVIFIPSLAFNQLTGVNVYIVACAQVLVCGLYTAFGGLKAVVWTDSVQTIIMFVGVILVGIAGTIAVGGFTEVLRIVNETGRFDFSNWSFSPYERQTGWSALIGGFVYWTCFNSVNQTMVQRYISLPSKKKVIQAVAIFCFGGMFSILICVWLGLAAWATWVQGGCHPGGMPLVDDRLLPAFVTYVARVMKMSGLSGVFLAGVFGAGLSSLSAILNACALVVIEDLVRGWLRLRLKPFTEGILVRVITVFLAVMSVVMLIVVQKLGGVLGVATALSAIAASATCGVFTLGMGCWWVGPKGAIAGAIAGALTSGGISMGSQAAAARGLRFPPLNMTTTCARNASVGVTLVEPLDPETVFPLFRISYHWIAPLGWLATLTAGMIVGKLFDKKEDVIADAELYAPCVWRCLPKEFIEKQGITRRTRAARETATAAPLMMTPIDKAETSR